MPPEKERLDAIYAEYARSGRKQAAWDAANLGNVAMRAELAGRIALAVRDLGSNSVLDVGCGTGWLLHALKERGTPEDRLVGVELQENRLAAAAASLPRARFLAGDARRLPFTSKSFALVTLVNVLSNMGSGEDVTAAAREAWRVTSTGGTLVIYEARVPSPNPNVRFVSRRALTEAIGSPSRVESLTLLPPLARRLGRATTRLHRPLAAIPLLRSHRMFVFER